MKFRYLVRYVFCALFFCTLMPFAVYGQSVSSSESESSRQLLNALQQQYVESRDKYEFAKKRLEEFEAKKDVVNDRLDRANISDASFADVMRLLQTQRVQLMIDLAGLEARYNLTVKDNPGTQSGDGAEKSPKLIAMLEKYVANQLEAVKATNELYKTGSVSPQDMRAAEKLLIEAQLRLEEARARSISIPDESSEQATGIAMELAEKQARLAMVEKLLKEYVDVRPSVEVIRHLSDQYNVMQGKYQSAREAMQQIERRLSKIKDETVDN